MAGAHQIAPHLLAGTHHIARGLLGECRHPDRRQAACHQLTHEQLRVAPIALDPLARPAWRLRRRDHLHRDPRLPRGARQAIPGRTGLVTGPHRPRQRLQPVDQRADLRARHATAPELAVTESTTLASTDRAWTSSPTHVIVTATARSSSHLRSAGGRISGQTNPREDSTGPGRQPQPPALQAIASSPMHTWHSLREVRLLEAEVRRKSTAASRQLCQPERRAEVGVDADVRDVRRRSLAVYRGERDVRVSHVVSEMVALYLRLDHDRRISA